MLWSSLNEISLCIALIMIILYGLFSLSVSSPSLLATKYLTTLNGAKTGAFNSGGINRSASLNLVNLFLKDVYFFSR